MTLDPETGQMWGNTERDAYYKGVNDGKEGVDICPYSGGPKARLWRQGHSVGDFERRTGRREA